MDLVRPEDIIDLNRTRLAAEMLEVNTQSLRILLGISISQDDEDILNKRLEDLTEDQLGVSMEADNLLYIINAYINDELRSPWIQYLEAAMNIEPLLREFVDIKLAENYFDNKLNEAGLRTFLVRMEKDLAFRRVAAIRLQSLQALYRVCWPKD